MRNRRIVADMGLSVLALGLLALPGTALARASTRDLQNQVDQVAGQLNNAEQNLRIVETQYTERAEPTVEELSIRRFSDGEIQYLLGDWRTSSVLFYDLVSDEQFKTTARYPDALFYLSDALYQQGSYIGARLYLRELLGVTSSHYKEALTRYLEIAGRLNEFSGIDPFIDKARELNGGELTPEVAYVYGKWLFKRTDLAPDERLRRVEAVFQKLAGTAGSPYRMQSAYFLGVSQVQRKNYDEAVKIFSGVTHDHATNDRELKVQELANLSLGRVLYETGKFDAAIDRYQEIPRESEYFPDSIYETAWVKVKKNDFDGAKNATELLGLVAPESTLKPESDLLQAHLLLKLHRYTEATDMYNSVINQYAPVRDEIDALLNVNRDAVAYFDNLLARNERNLDVNTLLPPVAVKWATTQREVADAVRMVNDLEGGRKGVDEGEEIANRILRALSERGLEAFPALQEGYTRADSVETSLTQSDVTLTHVEGELVADRQTPEERRKIDEIHGQMAALKQRVDTLPRDEKERAARRARMQARVDGDDKSVFKLGYEVQSMNAMLTAIQKWVADTRTQRRNTPEDEKSFDQRIQLEEDTTGQLQREVDLLRETLKEERTRADASVSGEDALRSRYAAMLAEEQALIAQAEGRLGADAGPIVMRAHEARERVGVLRKRTADAKALIQGQVVRRGEQIRVKVTAEQGLLVGYGKDVHGVSGDARQLVGRIAFDSFKRVRQQFYELVLKADVGIVDVAFTRKQDKTGDIQKLSAQKDHEIHALDEEFKEVLKDVD